MDKSNQLLITLCVTHRCNLSCRYCYQEHDAHSEMSIATAKKVIDSFFIPKNSDKFIEVDFIGGEPLIRFDLIKELLLYTIDKYSTFNFIFYLTTNGVLLSDDIKSFCAEYKNKIVLGLSLDGTRQSHNHNRSNSYDLIDFNYFLENWPNQAVKMTISDDTLSSLAENVIHIYSLGFTNINGVNLFEGDFDWDNESLYECYKTELRKLYDFYLEHLELPLCQLFDKHVGMLEADDDSPKKWCGIGSNINFFDFDGKKYPCSFCTPMTFEKAQMDYLQTVNFSDPSLFVDNECEDCYCYKCCPTCPGSCFKYRGALNLRDKSRCKYLQIALLYSADLEIRKIIKNPNDYSEKYIRDVETAAKKLKEKFGCLLGE